MYDVIVIGGGQSGLATGYYLQKAGLNFVILEAQARPVGSWSHYYQSLKLFSPAEYSNMPGYPFGGDPKRYPTRDEVIAYLDAYAKHFQLPVVPNATVARVEKDANGNFSVHLQNGMTYQARSMVAAAGAFNKPKMPIYPRQETFQGQILHSSQYQVPDTFTGKRVIVVGAGNSAIQIAVELARVANVSLATLATVKFRQQVTYGKDLHWWLKWTLIDYFPIGLWAKLVNRFILGSGVIDSGKFEEAINARQPDVRPMYSEFTSDGVVWADGTSETVDVVIYATGFKPNVEYLAPTGALDDDGYPQHQLGVSTSVDGLYYVGLAFQSSVRSATLRGAGWDAKFVVGRVQRHLKGLPCCTSERVRGWWKRQPA